MTFTSVLLQEVSNSQKNYLMKEPHPHQVEAFDKLNQIFTFPSEISKGGLLVIPTGGGKTFTAVNWICSNVLSKGIKVLWLAQSSNLLDQAYEAFYNSVGHVSPNRHSLNIRVVSSSPSHANVASIETTDDVLIITMQSAILNYNRNHQDQYGRNVSTYFKKFIESNRDRDFFVVLDEAHHAPAYGCRNFLMNLRQQIPHHYLLGLTATPTYTDNSRRGWLFEIFDQKIIYEADKAKLTAQNILAIPKYIEKPTGREYQVDDNLYHRLVREHKDLPDDIIEKLANDSARNDYIVAEYIRDRNHYGKTIIFADRWFQCTYIETKLKEKGVRAGSIFSKIDANPGTADARNKKTAFDNEKVIQEFKEGKLDVLINVRMLAEGADIPDVKTVFITRQTTSSILLTQMIGRALRGKKAGGGQEKSHANIVLFVDNWRQILNWASPEEGDKDGDLTVVRGKYPIEFISIQLIEELSKQIESGIGFAPTPFKETIPVGWYETNVTVNISEAEHEEMQSFTEYVMVYENTKEKYEKLISHLLTGNYPEEWADESLDESTISTDVQQYIERFFDASTDNIGNQLGTEIVKIIRHVAQNLEGPSYYSFDLRDQHDLDLLAKELMEYNDIQQHQRLQMEFNSPGKLWRSFYGTYQKFKTAFDAAKNRLIQIEIFGYRTDSIVHDHNKSQPNVRELTEAEKHQVMRRDGYKCLCCGIPKSKGRLEVDHILPVSMRGLTTVENSQTLCKICNRYKGIDHIDFRVNRTMLAEPKKFEAPAIRREENPEYALTRMINFFYYCHAVAKVNLHVRSNGRCYYVWEVELYQGNNPVWLQQNKALLLEFIQDELGYLHVKDVVITNV